MIASLVLSAVLDLTVGPVIHPELSAVVNRYAEPEAAAELAVLAAAGVPGAQAFADGLTAIKARDMPGACRAWESAADASAEAAHFTAECYEHGYGGAPRDIARSVALYSAAGDGGYAKSMCALGNLYAAGNGVPADPGRAVELCRRGAELGDRDAQTDLANFYLSGQGVPEDKAEARRWYERAAEQNQRNALFTLGQMYWYGDTVENDPARAILLWEAAWGAGRRDAALMIARAFVSETAATRQTAPLDHAVRWYDLAIPHIEDPLEKAKVEREREAMRTIRANGPNY